MILSSTALNADPKVRTTISLFYYFFHATCPRLASWLPSPKSTSTSERLKTSLSLTGDQSSQILQSSTRWAFANSSKSTAASPAAYLLDQSTYGPPNPGRPWEYNKQQLDSRPVAARDPSSTTPFRSLRPSSTSATALYPVHLSSFVRLFVSLIR